MSDLQDGITWLEAAVPHPYHLVFTNRNGGVSGEPYATLNLGFNTGDDPSDVTENRLRMAGRLATPLDRWTLVRQVHSSRVALVDRERIGAGSGDYASGLDDADAMVTREAGAVLCVLAADCVPVAIYGGSPPAIALIHSGWKGTYEEVSGAALDELRRLFGTEAHEVGATLGPGIRRCCYRVEDERVSSFRERFGESGVEGSNLDLFHAIRTTLIRKGVKEERISDTGICTACDNDYYSFRRDGTTGRQAALLWIEGPG